MIDQSATRDDGEVIDSMRLLSATRFGVRIWLLPHHHDRHVGLGV